MRHMLQTIKKEAFWGIPPWKHTQQSGPFTGHMHSQYYKLVKQNELYRHTDGCLYVLKQKGVGQ